MPEEDKIDRVEVKWEAPQLPPGKELVSYADNIQFLINPQGFIERRRKEVGPVF